MRISILGTGNVATILGYQAVQSGHQIMQVFGRNHAKAKVLADALQSVPVSSFEAIQELADLYLIAFSDEALVGLHEQFSVKKGMVVHTSGATPKEVLEKVCPNFGVLYPLQSLSANKLHYEPFPLLIEGNTSDDTSLVQFFAETLTSIVVVADAQKRLEYHLAAVFANNFSNHMIALAERFSNGKKIDFQLLKPIIKETFARLDQMGPIDSQTGPARRGDSITAQKHLELLKDLPQYAAIYDAVTASIKGFYSK